MLQLQTSVVCCGDKGKDSLQSSSLSQKRIFFFGAGCWPTTWWEVLQTTAEHLRLIDRDWEQWEQGESFDSDELVSGQHVCDEPFSQQGSAAVCARIQGQGPLTGLTYQPRVGEAEEEALQLHHSRGCACELCTLSHTISVASARATAIAQGGLARVQAAGMSDVLHLVARGIVMAATACFLQWRSVTRDVGCWERECSAVLIGRHPDRR